MHELELIDRAERAYRRSRRDRITPQPAAGATEVVRQGGRTTVLIRNGYDVLARYDLTATGRLRRIAVAPLRHR